MENMSVPPPPPTGLSSLLQKGKSLDRTGIIVIVVSIVTLILSIVAISGASGNNYNASAGLLVISIIGLVLGIGLIVDGQRKSKQANSAAPQLAPGPGQLPNQGEHLPLNPGDSGGLP